MILHTRKRKQKTNEIHESRKQMQNKLIFVPYEKVRIYKLNDLYIYQWLKANIMLQFPSSFRNPPLTL